MAPEQAYKALVADKIIQALQRRNMEGYYCETKEDALKKSLELIEKKSSVSWGGSMSVENIGLIDAVKNDDYIVIDRDSTTDPAERRSLMLKAMDCDYYLMSTNAISKDGVLYNVDGIGNRVAALAFGPRNIIIVAGMNKVVSCDKEGYGRIRNTAAIMNCLRLGKKTPCSLTGACQECLGDDCLCTQIITTRMSRIKNRIKVILVGETLGY